MSHALALAGWTAAVLGVLAGFCAARLAGARLETVARAAHDLRGAITAARLGVELCLIPGEMNAARLRAIELELEAAGGALADLDDRGRSKPAHSEALDLGQLLADTVEAWRPAARAAGIELSLRQRDSTMTTVADRPRLARAVGNLIANAIEHGGGPIEVRGGADRGLARIEVIDGGAGLPAPVTRLTRARRGRGARGRGLAIAGTIAEEHGGRLACAPSERGARLVLELPLGARPAGHLRRQRARRRRRA